MFTGLVADRGSVIAIDRSPDGARLEIATDLAGEIGPGDSVAVNGVCLTATAIEAGRSFTAEVMNQTLAATALAKLAPGAPVNLELALRPLDRLGGHVVQGHVDATGTIRSVHEDGFARRVRIDAPPEVLRYIVPKGSIAVDGVSLTVAAADNGSFTVSLIPETLERTNLGAAHPGESVNLEVDVLAKYVERLVSR